LYTVQDRCTHYSVLPSSSKYSKRRPQGRSPVHTGHSSRYIFVKRGAVVPALDNNTGGGDYEPLLFLYTEREIRVAGGRGSRARRQYRRGGITSTDCFCMHIYIYIRVAGGRGSRARRIYRRGVVRALHVLVYRAYMLNTRGEEYNTAFYSYLACFIMKTVTLNMYISMSYTGLSRRNTVFVFLWLLPRNT